MESTKFGNRKCIKLKNYAAQECIFEYLIQIEREECADDECDSKIIIFLDIYIFGCYCLIIINIKYQYMLKSQKSEGASDSCNNASDKAKIQVLKKAVLELREQKEQLEISNQSLSIELDKVLKEKDQNEQSYIELVEELKQRISILEGNIETTPVRIQSQSNFSAQIVKAEGTIDQQLQTMIKLNKQLQQEIKIMQNNFQAQSSILQHEQKNLQKELSNKETILGKLSKELEEANILNRQLKKNIHDIEQDLYNKIIEQSQINTELKIKIQNFEQNLLENETEKQNLENIIEQQKLNILELEEIRGKFLQHRLILKNQLLEINCAFILRQNIYNDYILELETPAKRFIYKANEITDLQVKDDKHFILTLSKRQETFKLLQGQDIRKICKSIKSFLIKSQIQLSSIQIK
ncbi:unnamed protein product [Paramecium pentaurelia]|uniref:Uncharacterized protein n=1 Tax=Paramecium pentaurelia TaxID=43138 RepID=A0A8S1UUP6_9CILI|nr:unnamed protein product [Paramecium pentaurelia]